MQAVGTINIGEYQMERSEESAKFELLYWLQVANDSRADNKSIGEINKQLDRLAEIGVALALEAAATFDEEPVKKAETILDVVQSARAACMEIMDRSLTRAEMVMGRIEVIKKEVNDNGDDTEEADS